MRFVPLGAALHLTYEMKAVGGEYTYAQEVKYWQRRVEMGEAHWTYVRNTRPAQMWLDRDLVRPYMPKAGRHGGGRQKKVVIL